jgi:hypothetical protein
MSTYVLGEFRHSGPMITALRALRESGEKELDAYSPYPLHGTSEALGLTRSRVPALALTGGLLGAFTGYGMQWWMNAVDYPINVGGRPLHSAPSWVPITFELGVLFASFFIFFGSLGLFGFPRPYHPVFEAEEFRRASVGTFWVSVDLGVEAGRASRVQQRLEELGAMHVSIVEGAVK